MKKRILALGLAACLFFQSTGIAAVAAENQTVVEPVAEQGVETEHTNTTKLATPENLQWKENGTICWDEVEGAQGSYAIVLKDANNQDFPIDKYDYRNSESKGSYEYYYGPLIEASKEGTYIFEVKAGAMGDTLSSEWAKSEPFEYTPPSASLTEPTNLRWETEKKDGIYACWDEVEGAAGYQVKFYSYNNQEHEEVATYTEYKGGNRCEINFADNIYYGDEINYGDIYDFQVSALSSNILTTKSSAFSEMSPKYDASTALENASSALENVLGKLEGKTDSDEIIRIIDDLVDNIGGNIGEFAAVMKKNSDSLSNVKRLEEDYKKASNIVVENKVAEGISINKDEISVTGAALNAGTNTNVSLNFNNLSEDSGIKKDDWQYANTVQLDINLTGTDSENISLKVPVHITMPVPEGIDISRLEILHYTSSDQYERLELKKDYKNNMVSFVVTSFSPFVFAEKSTDIYNNPSEALQSLLNELEQYKAEETTQIITMIQDFTSNIASKKDEVAEAMLKDNTFVTNLKKLEEYYGYEKKGLIFDNSNIEGISYIGHTLTDGLELTISSSDTGKDDFVYSHGIDISTRKSMILTVPIYITVPVPEGTNIENVNVFIISSSGTKDHLETKIDTTKKTISFVIKEFTNDVNYFVIGELKKQLPTPELEWNVDGILQWEKDKDTESYEVSIKWDEAAINDAEKLTFWTVQDGTYQYFYGPLMESKKGKHTFIVTVKAKAKSDNYRDSEATLTFNYNQPSSSLTSPEGLTWETSGDKIYACWDKVEAAAGYMVTVYKKTASETTLASYVVYKGADVCRLDVTDAIDSYMKDYCFTVSALSADINKTCSSETSAQSAVLDPLSDLPAALCTTLNKIQKTSSDAEVKVFVEEFVNAVEKYNKESVFAEKMETDSAFLENVQKLEADYMDAIDINALYEIKSDAGLSMNGKISAIGLALNGVRELLFKPSETGVTIDTSTWKNKDYQLIDIAYTADTALKTPIRITMPVPNGMTMDKVEVFQYKATDNYPSLKLNKDTDNHTISFVVEDFDFTTDGNGNSKYSTFVFAEPTREKPTLSAPTDLKRDTTTGMISWNAVSDAEDYKLVVYKGNSEVVNTTIQANPLDFSIKNGVYTFLRTDYLDSSGTYTFKVKAAGNGYTESEWATDTFEYTKPEESSVLTAPAGLVWKENGDKVSVCWDKVAGAAKYEVEISIPDTSDSSVSAFTINQYIVNTNQIDVTNDIFYPAKYSFKVRALSSNIATTSHSAYRNLEKDYTETISKNPSVALSRLLIYLSKWTDFPLETQKFIERFIAGISTCKDDFADAMGSNSGFLSNLQKLEEKYKEATGISVQYVCNSNYLDVSKISAIGVALNKEPYLKFSKVNDSISDSSWTYEKTVQMEISYKQNDALNQGSHIPIYITMPVPENLDIDELELWQYCKKDSRDKLKLYKNKKDNTISFVVKELKFSSFSEAEGGDIDNYWKSSFVFGGKEKIPTPPTPSTPPSDSNTPSNPTPPSTDTGRDDIEDDKDVEDDVDDDIKEDISHDYRISYQGSAVYTGSAITPNVTVKDGSRVLAEGVDYSITYKNNVNVGTAQFTIRGKGGHELEETKSFVINACSLSDASIRVSDIYSEKTVKNPVPVITRDGKKLSNGKDFTLTYENGGVYSKSGKIIVTGKGNYTGSISVAVTVVDAKTTNLMSKVSVSNVKNFTYGGSYEQHPTVKFGKTILQKGKDYEISYENTEQAGTATMVLTGKGDYVGEKRVNFKITGTSIRKAKVSGLDKVVNYTGSEIKADYTLTLNGTTLKEGTDYTVSYGKNVSAGKASITFTGMGAYTDSVKKSFTIGKCSLETANVSLAANVTYAKGGAKPKLSITVGAMTLREKSDYTVSYKNNKKVGATATVTITGKGSFTGKLVKTFTVGKQNLSNVKISADDLYVKNGKIKKFQSKVVLTDVDGKKLSAGKDYDKNIIYKDANGNILKNSKGLKVGDTITVTVTGKGAYEGSATTTYKILKK